MFRPLANTLRIIISTVLLLVCGNALAQTKSPHFLGKNTRISKTLPLPDGAVAAGYRNNQALLFWLPSTYQQGGLNAREQYLGTGMISDLVSVGPNILVAGTIDDQDLLVLLNRQGERISGFGQEGGIVLNFEPKVVAWDKERHQIIVAGSGHHHFKWLVVDADRGFVLRQSNIKGPDYWYMPVALSQSQTGWLAGVALSNGLYQAQSIFMLSSDNRPEENPDYLLLKDAGRLLGLQWSGNSPGALVQSTSGQYWFDLYDPVHPGQPSASYSLHQENTTAVSLSDQYLLLATRWHGLYGIWEQPLFPYERSNERPEQKPVLRATLLPGMMIEQINAVPGSLWLTGLYGNEYFIAHVQDIHPEPFSEDSVPAEPSSSQHRINRQVQECSTISGSTLVCLEGADCSINNGVMFLSGITNEITTFINTDISTEIETSLDTRINTLINLAANIQVTIRTTIDTTVIARTRLSFENEITTDLSAEAGTLKAALDGQFVLDSRIATVEASADITAAARTALFTRFDGISTNLTALVRTDAELEARLTGARARLAGDTSAAASGSFLGGAILGSLFMLGTCSAKVCIGKALGAVFDFCLVSVCGPLGVLYKCVRR